MKITSLMLSLLTITSFSYQSTEAGIQENIKNIITSNTTSSIALALSSAVILFPNKIKNFFLQRQKNDPFYKVAIPELRDGYAEFNAKNVTASTTFLAKTIGFLAACNLIKNYLSK